MKGEIGFNPEADPELAIRTGLLKDDSKERVDLFTTKLFSLEGSGSKQENARQVLTLSRDPGSANALALVLAELVDDPSLDVKAVVDGRAQQILTEKFKASEIVLEDPLAVDKAVPSPAVIVADASEEKGLDTYANATFREVPMVLIEDNPGSSHVYLSACNERPGLRFPDRICVMDMNAKKALIDKFPELEEKTVVTGQPAFDRIAKEDIPAINLQVRQKLNIAQGEKLVSFMSTDEVTSDQFEKVCAQIAQAKTPFKFIFRRHPRDNTSYEGYFEILKKYGIEPIDSSECSTDQVSAASDLVMTSWSTAGLEAIYRGKPTMYVVDKEVIPKAAGLELPLPAVKLGASIEAEDVKTIPNSIDQLLDSDSEIHQEIKRNMLANYPNDGKNANRVAQVVREVIASSASE